MNVSEVVSEIAEPIVGENGCELVDVEYKKEGPRWYLRVYVDKPGGVNVDDCEAISRQLGVVLDVKDPIPHTYVLEVSSPGMERAIKKDADFRRYQGRRIRVRTFAAIAGQKDFEGTLDAVEGDAIIVKGNKGEVRLPWDQVASAHLIAWQEEGR